MILRAALYGVRVDAIGVRVLNFKYEPAFCILQQVDKHNTMNLTN